MKEEKKISPLIESLECNINSVPKDGLSRKVSCKRLNTNHLDSVLFFRPICKL